MYLTHDNLENYWTIDTEADDLNPTVFWCFVLQNCKTMEVVRFYEGLNCYEQFKKWFHEHPEAIFVGHNIVSFDAYHIRRLLGLPMAIDRIVDTMVLSYLYNPHLKGGHSLRAWGDRFKFPKGDHSDWSKFTPEMLEYCERDVRVTTKLFLKLSERMRRIGYSEESCKLEHEIREVIDEQKRVGFWFDKRAAEKLRDGLRKKQKEAERRVHAVFPPVLEVIKTLQYKVKKNGQPHSSYIRNVSEYPAVEINYEDGTYDVYDYSHFNIGSPKQRVERLLEQGWKPTEKTKGGSWKCGEAEVMQFAEAHPEVPEVALIADWLIYSGRANMIDNWLNNLGDDSRIHGTVMTCGAASRRMTHSGPNTANIPGVDSRYGKESRALWGVPPGKGRKLVGFDSTALESRMMLHYLNISDPELVKFYLDNKPAKLLEKALEGKHSYMSCKTSWYAFTYGCFPKKTAQIFGVDQKEGDYIHNEVLANIVPGIGDLIRRTQKEFDDNNGRIKVIDGGYVICPSRSAALNYKLQPAGGIVMKKTSVIADRYIKKLGLDALKVGDIHDEGQYDTKEDQAVTLGEYLIKSHREAGEFFNLNVPLDAEYAIGNNWSETH